MNFTETVAGQRFLNHDFPSLVKSAERIAKAMEEQNKTAAKPYLLISVLDREITAGAVSISRSSAGTDAG